MTAILREHAEQQYAEELDELARADQRQRPPNWKLSPWAVATYLLGGTLDDGFVVTPKYIGNRRLIEIAIATLATDRALLLLGVPGTAKTLGLRAPGGGDLGRLDACWSRAPPAPARSRSATAGTTPGCWPRARRARRWCPAR